MNIKQVVKKIFKDYFITLKFGTIFKIKLKNVILILTPIYYSLFLNMMYLYIHRHCSAFHVKDNLKISNSEKLLTIMIGSKKEIFCYLIRSSRVITSLSTK